MLSSEGVRIRHPHSQHVWAEPESSAARDGQATGLPLRVALEGDRADRFRLGVTSCIGTDGGDGGSDISGTANKGVRCVRAFRSRSSPVPALSRRLVDYLVRSTGSGWIHPRVGVLTLVCRGSLGLSLSLSLARWRVVPIDLARCHGLRRVYRFAFRASLSTVSRVSRDVNVSISSRRPPSSHKLFRFRSRSRSRPTSTSSLLGTVDSVALLLLLLLFPRRRLCREHSSSPSTSPRESRMERSPS